MVSVCKNPATEYECVDKVKCVSNEYKCDGLPDCDDESDESPVMCKFSFLNISAFISKNVKTIWMIQFNAISLIFMLLNKFLILKDNILLIFNQLQCILKFCKKLLHSNSPILQFFQYCVPKEMLFYKIKLLFKRTKY